EEELAATFAAYAASAPTRNTTLEAIHSAELGGGVSARTPTATVPFSSRRRWSALELDGRRLVLGAPETLLDGSRAGSGDASPGGGAAGSAPGGTLADRAAEEAATGRRVLALASYGAP